MRGDFSTFVMMDKRALNRSLSSFRGAFPQAALLPVEAFRMALRCYIYARQGDWSAGCFMNCIISKESIHLRYLSILS